MQPAPDTQNATRRTARGGFTLLEILVVIGIILLLVAIGVIAFGALDQSGKVTKTTLANCQSMLAEFQAQTDLRDQPEFVYRGTTTKAPTRATPPAIGASLWREPAEIGNSDETDGDVNSGSLARYKWATVVNTQLVLQFLNRFPGNKQIMTRLPSKQVLGTIAPGEDRGVLLGTPGTATAPGTLSPPLVLDAWNNPIIFVGSDGLAGVTIEAKKDPQRITSVGLFDYNGNPFDTTNLPRTRRPFFASAGPDGDFKAGDDNVYSFDAQ